MGHPPTGNAVAGSFQALGAATGYTKQTEYAAEATSTVTSVLGFGTLVGTGNMNKASFAAAFEGLVTSDPKDLVSGGTMSRLANAHELMDNFKKVSSGVNEYIKTHIPTKLSVAH